MSRQATSSSTSETCVGAARVEITPPLDVGILMSSVEQRWAPFEGVESPLMARAIVISGATAGPADAVAVVALDLLGLSDKAVGGWSAFKKRVSEFAGSVVHAERIVFACSHTHSGPESAGLSDLYATPQHHAWIAELASRIGAAICDAAWAARPCRFEYGVAAAPGLGIHRRIHTTQGILLSHPPPPEGIVLSRKGPVDDSVNLLTARDAGDGSLIAMIVNATCHPVHEMCIPRVSADFPGVVTSGLERSHPGCAALFLNGAAGNINPTTVSGGPDASRVHGEALTAVVERLISDDAMTPCDNAFALGRRAVSLPSRLPNGRPDGRPVRVEVAAVHIGSMAFAFLPGEPFVETALAIREHSRFAVTAVVGFAEDYVGYVPTDAAFIDGGYETTFGRWSVLAPGCEPALRSAASDLLDDLRPSRPSEMK
jgi:hypothetical protein